MFRWFSGFGDKSTHNSSWYVGGGACAAAAGGGHVPVLKWLREKGAKWDARSCAEAAMRGHLDCLRWLIENECPQDDTTFYWGVKWGATSGCMALLEYLVEQGCPWGTSPWTRKRDAEDDVAVWLTAASEGSVELVQWLYETEIKQSVPWTIDAGYAAARAGRLDNLRFLYENKPSLDGDPYLWKMAVSDSDRGYDYCIAHCTTRLAFLCLTCFVCPQQLVRSLHAMIYHPKGTTPRTTSTFWRGSSRWIGPRKATRTAR